MNRARSRITKSLIGHDMEYGPYLSENKKSLAKKRHDQTDTLKGPLQLSRREWVQGKSKQEKLKVQQKGYLMEQNT